MLSLGEKVELVRRIDSGEKQIDVAKDYDIAKNTVSAIYANRQRIADSA